MSEKTKLVKNTMLITIGNFGVKMISFFLLPLYTTLLSTSEYGVYDFVIAIGAFLIPVITLSMPEAMFRFLIDSNNNEEKKKRIFSNAFFVVIFGIIVCGIISAIIYVINSNISVIYVFLYVSASALYTLSNNLLRGSGKMKMYAVISSSVNLIQLLINVVAVAVFKVGVVGLIFSLCISEVCTFILVCFILKLWKKISIKKLSREEISEMLKYSLPLIPNTLSSQIINISDRIIISFFCGPAINGIYSVAYKFPNIVETVYHFFYIAWSESASRVMLKGKEAAQKYYNSLFKSINRLVFAVVACMIAGMPIIFRIFVKGDYIEGINYVVILMVAIYFDCIAKFLSGIFTAFKKTKVMASSTIISALINLIINISLIKKIGLYAASISTLISEIFLVLFRYKILKKDMKLDINKLVIFKELFIILILVLLFDNDNLIKTIISIIIALIYGFYSNKDIIRSTFNMLVKKIIKEKK